MDRRAQLLELNDQVLAVGTMHALQGDYEKTILLLKALKSGAVGLDDFVIVNNGWQLALDRQSPDVAIQDPPPPIDRAT